MIIGICGRKRHGKDTVGKILQTDRGFQPLAFADPVKKIAMDLCGLSYMQCYGEQEDKETVDARWGVSPRHIMQVIGTEMGRNVHKDVWIRKAFDTMMHVNLLQASVEVIDHELQCFTRKRLRHDTSWCVTDLRFPNEAESIKQHDGIVIKVVRSSLIDSGNLDTHASETSIDLINADYTIYNDGSLEDLRISVLSLLPGLDQVRN